MSTMTAQPLAAAAFVLGRARRGTDTLYKAMYARMMDLLEVQEQVTPSRGEKIVFGNDQLPQDFLERFLHGIAMMGPDRKKDLDTQWLMQWLCKHVYTFEL